MVRPVGQAHQGRCEGLQLLQGAVWREGPKEQGDGGWQFRARTLALSGWLSITQHWLSITRHWVSITQHWLSNFLARLQG